MAITTKNLANMFRYVAKNKNRPKSEDIASKTSMYNTLGKVIFSVARLPSVMKSDAFLKKELLYSYNGRVYPLALRQTRFFASSHPTIAISAKTPPQAIPATTLKPRNPQMIAPPAPPLAYNEFTDLRQASSAVP